ASYRARRRERGGARRRRARGGGGPPPPAAPADPGALACDEAIREGRGFAHVLTFRRPDGTLVSALSQAAPDRDASGRLVGFVGTLTDVSEMRRIDAALRESERVAARLAEVSPVGIFRTDAAGRPTYLNERCYDISGLGPDEVATEAAFWPRTERPEDLAVFVEARSRSVRQRAPIDQEVRFLRPDGSPAWALVQALPDFDEDGRFARYVG